MLNKIYKAEKRRVVQLQVSILLRPCP